MREEELTQRDQAYNEMRSVWETATSPLMELARTNDGDAVAYLHMEIEERPDGDGAHCGVLPEDPIVTENGEMEARWVDAAT